MARINDVKAVVESKPASKYYQKKGSTVALAPIGTKKEDAELENYTVRLPRFWIAILKRMAKDLSMIRERRIRPADVVRDALFRYCVKSFTKDERQTILRAGKSMSEDAGDIC